MCHIACGLPHHLPPSPLPLHPPLTNQPGADQVPRGEEEGLAAAGAKGAATEVLAVPVNPMEMKMIHVCVTESKVEQGEYEREIGEGSRVRR